MRGHLQQRSRDTWRLKVYVGRSADGKRRYLARTVRGSRREAERELARLVVEVGEGRHGPFLVLVQLLPLSFSRGRHAHPRA